MAKLLLKKKAEIIAEYLISKASITIGNSEDNDIHIPDKSVSTNHCEIQIEDKKFVLKDNKSAFGTYITNERVAVKNIAFGEHIRFGNSPYSVILIPEDDDITDNNAPFPSLYVLIGIQGKFAGKIFELVAGETRIGRDEDYNDIILSGKIDPSVSRRHSTIQSDGRQMTISDRRSRNRTFVNQTQIGEADSIPLNIDDEIVIGHTIFRLCMYGEEDFSSPRKASIFIERMKIPFVRGCSLVIGLAAAGLLIVNIRSCMIVKDIPDMPVIETSAWSPDILKGDPRSTLPDEYDTTASCAVGDISGKGLVDAIFAFSYGKVYAWAGDSGDVVWDQPFDIEAPITTSPTLIDINNDNAVDIILAGGNSHVYVIDGVSGKLIYKSPLLGGTLSGSPAVGDINRDGIDDIVVCSEDGIVHFIYNPLAGGKIKTAKVSGEILAAPVIYQDISETVVIVATAEGKLYLYNGSSLESKTIDTVESINKFIGSNLPINEITSTPVVADLNGDGRPEIIALSNQYYVTAVNMISLDVEWIYHIEPPSIKEQPRHVSSPVLADLDGDALPDVVITACNGRVIALKGTSGEVLWEYETGDWNRLISSPAAADIDKDGFPDIIFGGEDGYLYGLSGAYELDPESDRLFFKHKVDATPITSSPSVADVDNDGYLDILVSNMSGDLHIYRTNTRVFRGAHPFAMQNADAGHQGHVILHDPMPKILIQASASIIIIFGAFISQIFLKRKMTAFKPKIYTLE